MHSELIQFTGSPFSCPRSSEDLAIQLPFQTFSQFLLMPSRVSKIPDDHTALIIIFSLAIVLLFFAYFSDKLRLRWPFVLAGLLSSAVGFAINISNASNGVKYFGTFLCVAGTYSSSPGIVAW